MGKTVKKIGKAIGKAVKGVGKALKKVSNVVLPAVATFALGPAGLGLSTTMAGVIGGGIAGLASGGGIQGALTGAALGGLGGWGASKMGFGSGGLGGFGGSAGSGGVGGFAGPGTTLGFGGAGPAASGLGSMGFGGVNAAQQALAATSGFGAAPAAAATGAAAAPATGGGFLSSMSPTTQSMIKGGIGIAKNLYQAQQQEAMAKEMAEMADPFQKQRGQAIGMGQAALEDPTGTPLYQQSLAEAEQALKRRQAASGNFYSGGALEEAAQLPASVAAQLQAQQISGAGTVAGAAGGNPAAGAQLYGQAQEDATKQKGELFQIGEKLAFGGL